MAPEPQPRRFQITVCRGPECGDRRGSAAVADALRAALVAHGLADRAQLGWQSCFGRCSQGPNVLVREITPDGGSPPVTGESAAPPAPRATALYNAVLAVNADELIRRHVGAGEVVRSLIQPPTLLGSGRGGPRSPGSRR